MDDKKDDNDNGASYMYFRDYQNDGEADVEQTVKNNHKTEGALISKAAAKLQGRGGRFRGKNGARENNKARGGKKAR